MFDEIVGSIADGFLFGGAAMNFHIPGFRKVRNSDILVKSIEAFSELSSRPLCGVVPDIVLDRRDFKIAKIFAAGEGSDDVEQIRFFWFDDFPPDGFGPCRENPRVLSLDALLVAKLFAQTETLPFYFDHHKNLVDLAALFRLSGEEVFVENVEKLRAFYGYTSQFPNNLDRAVAMLLSREKELGRSMEKLGVATASRRGVPEAMLEMAAVVRRICGKKNPKYEDMLKDYAERCL